MSNTLFSLDKRSIVESQFLYGRLPSFIFAADVKRLKEKEKKREEYSRYIDDLDRNMYAPDVADCFIPR